MDMTSNRLERGSARWGANHLIGALAALHLVGKTVDGEVGADDRESAGEGVVETGV